ncbi:MAG: cytochrome c biogenesis protein [Chitinophagales bacterium]|nr:cytochrome c biogenesis protein [Chitinophagales bacterium]
MESFLKQRWWKITGVILLACVIIGGLWIPLYQEGTDNIHFPNLPILNESIRNLLFHVPMWFAMVTLLLLSFIYSIRYLNKPGFENDNYANSFAIVGVVFGALGIFTGMVWAKSTWGAPWTNDPKLNGAAVGMLIYIAYLILRASIDDENKRAKISATYNIFAFVIYIAFIFVIPRLTDSLHPGNGGNPAFSSYDLDNTLRLFFYPASIGWIVLSLWIAGILTRINRLQHKTEQ